MGEASGSSFRSKLRAAGVGALLVGVLGLGLSGYVTWTLWSGWAADNERHSKAIAELGASRDTLTEQQGTAEQTRARLEGAIAVARAVVELDRRNFGAAQAEIERAAGLLDGVGPNAQTGVPPKIVAEQATRLHALKLEVSADIGEQRNQLVAIFELLTAG